MFWKRSFDERITLPGLAMLLTIAKEKPWSAFPPDRMETCSSWDSSSVGLIRKQFLHVNWNQATAIHYNQATRTFAVYTTKPTKRATPAMTIRVHNLDDAKTIAHTAQTASAAPRLDIT